jgi:hypothetical protein
MPKCINVPRFVAEDWPHHITTESVGLDVVWISIGEPEPQFKFKPSLLDSRPNLKLSFLDWSVSLDGMETMSARNAHDIVEFILTHPDKNLVVNCGAGVSRSGSICQFCQDVLGYEWDDFYKSKSIPRPEFVEKLKYQHGRILKRNKNKFDKESKLE